ncbi:glycine oxidase ThiO [Gracilibacillus sp. YIM 98692]|uniref:glycine oxidase ThiO n=1 Tax=Gracilibacillus sp. YIM 98692 TaxID=2663532 RepID=UPI001F08986B|nr:glycine oxidase ThiO [Gracilibacillus sp. YIM 98692]
MYDQIVIGGGVIGCSIAYQLAKRGYQVLVLEKDSVASGASSAAAGMLGAQVEFTQDGPLFQFARESRQLYPQIEKELFEYSGIDIQLIQKGMYKMALTEEQLNHLQQLAAFQKQFGEEAYVLTPDDMMAREQKVSNQIKGALHIPGDGQVSAIHVTKAFAKAAESFGAEVKENTSVEELLIENEKVSGVVTKSETFYAEKVVLASGVWTKDFQRYFTKDTEMYPVKGECISVRPDQPLVEATIFSEGCYIVPKKDGHMIIGATSLPYQMDKKVSAGGIHSLLDKAMYLIPEIKDAEIEKVWTGFRPQTKDELPYLDKVDEVEGLFIAAGHYRNGILLAPITGLFMADLIEGKAISSVYQEAFSIKRKQNTYV